MKYEPEFSEKYTDNAQNQKPLPPAVQQVVDAIHDTNADPLGSYTGTDSTDPEGTPTQDADDL